MKHAFLIMAHNQFDLLGRLLQALDHADNHLFVHIDAKAKAVDFDALSSCCKHSPLTFVPRMLVYWGGYSQIQCELSLMKHALASGAFDYYHLLSGVDYPIQPMQNIHHFFRDNAGKEFVAIVLNWAESKEVNKRYALYHLFQDTPYKKSGNSKVRSVCDFAHGLSMRVQVYLLRIDRTKKPGFPKKIYGGMNWFSITDDLCRWVIEKESQIEATFKYGSCVDEFFLQTILMDSPYAANRYQPEPSLKDGETMRLVDWQRGTPYVWQLGDYDELVTSGCLFARKFNYETPEEKELINRLAEFLNT